MSIKWGFPPALIPLRMKNIVESIQADAPEWDFHVGATSMVTSFVHDGESYPTSVYVTPIHPGRLAYMVERNPRRTDMQGLISDYTYQSMNLSIMAEALRTGTYDRTTANRFPPSEEYDSRTTRQAESSSSWCAVCDANASCQHYCDGCEETVCGCNSSGVPHGSWLEYPPIYIESEVLS